MHDNWPWDVLGLECPVEDRKAVKRAYARTLKTIDQGAEPERFQALRQALEMAERMVATPAPQRAAPAPAPRPDPFPDPLPEPVLAGAAASEAPPMPAAEPVRPDPLIEFPDQEPAPEPAPSTDWEKLDLLTRRIANPALSLKSRLVAVCGDPVMTDPVIHDEVERALYNHLMQVSEPAEGGGIILPDSVDTDVAKAIDDNFGWLSDYTTFRRKFRHGADDLAYALGYIHFPVSADMERITQRVQSEAEGHWATVVYLLTAFFSAILALRLTGSAFVAMVAAIGMGKLAQFILNDFRNRR